MKKTMILYMLYLTAIWGYFLYLYPLESFGSTKYAAIAHAVYFSKLPLEFILLYALIKKGWSDKWADRLDRLTQLEWVKTSIFSFFLVLLYGLIRFPFNLLWFRIAHSEGTSRQPVGDWLFEMGLDLFFYWVVLALGIYLTRILIKKHEKNWWFYVWLLALPIAVFVVYVQPVWIDPLYEDFTEMREGPLRTEIENFTEAVGLEDATLLQVNMSEKVTTFNAYVTGIMGNARIVLWDTTIEGMEQDEILFILAHEVGHYVKKHVYLGVAGYLLLSLVLLATAAYIYKRVWISMKQKKQYASPNDLRAIPSLLLVLSILMIIAQPISMYVSRQIELSADEYAITHTENLNPAVESYKRLAIQSRSDIDPVFWVKWMRYSHPPIEERIELVQEEMQKRETKTLSSS